VGCTPDGYIFNIRTWELPAYDPDWQVPRQEVMETIYAAFQRWKVLEFAYDPPGWTNEMQELEADYGEAVVVRFPTNTRQRMAEACGRFYTSVLTGDLTHDGSPIIASHLDHCETKPSPYGTLIVKRGGKDSGLKIDAAVAAVVAHDRARQRREAVYTGSIFL
jgi:phage terminase large subunit-like protein